MFLHHLGRTQDDIFHSCGHKSASSKQTFVTQGQTPRPWAQLH